MMKREFDYVPVTIHRPDPFTTCQYETRYVWVTRYYYEADGKTETYVIGGGGGDESGGGMVLLLGGVALIIYFIVQGDFFNPKPATADTWQTFWEAVSFCYRHSLHIFLISLKFAIWDVNVMVWNALMHASLSVHDVFMDRSRNSVFSFETIGGVAFFLYLTGIPIGVAFAAKYMEEKYPKAFEWVVVTIVAAIPVGFLIFPGLAGLCGWLGVLAYQSW
ncbi:hypothetical protein [Azospirillum agricola]|uniref:hypothetical protein n=1 Tax=Azospirillum agricola TaxID=1720247 RepID=UPI001177B405|nr:hypothetical protein [Azospirillum agricola]